MDAYNTISTLNEAHKIYIVQHTTTHKIYVEKILDVYNISVYEQLYRNPIAGIPRIINYYEQDGQLILIEEYISGVSLLDKINNSELTAPAIRKYMLMLCDTLQLLHSMTPSIIHRDIKPSNIVITAYDYAILLDFNAAKQFHKDAPSDTILLGTPGYAAPEQFGFGSSSPLTDIYSLGIVLREMVSSLTYPTSEFDPIIEKCTQLTPASRYQSVPELRQELAFPVFPVAQARNVPKKPQRTVPDKTVTKPNALPPGFRTKTPWKMVIASVVYLFLLWLCLSLTFKNTYGAQLWLERFFVLAMFLSIIFCHFNYLDVQRTFPLCKSKYRLLHYLGVILLDITIVFSLLIILAIIEVLCFRI